jgi:peptidoglycan L-alanyl-D-glutamate endopeptidase CwlK|tara:strand:+ start:3004 stop:3405 length:402 start_codon:yes stop_codon:yes gene_type:complete
MTYQLSRSSQDHRKGIDPKLIEISDLAIELTNIDFGIPSTGGFRTAGVQKGLYESKKSKADGVTNLSKHQLGYAIDFFPYVDGRASYEIEHLAQVACAFLQAASQLGYKVKSGGLWSSYRDWPHIELDRAETT